MNQKNMNKIRYILTAVLCCLIAIPTSGQEMTLEQCRTMALKNNKRIVIAKQDKERANLIAGATRTNFLPKFTTQGAAMFGNSKTDMSIALLEGMPNFDLNLNIKKIYMAGINLEQPIYMGGKITSAYKMSKVGNEIAELNRALTEDEILLETDQAYWMCIQAKELKQSAQQYKITVEEFYRVVTHACETGLKSKNDLMKIQVQLNQANLQLHRAENGVRLSQMNLCNIIGLPLQSELLLSGTFSGAPIVINHTIEISSRPEYLMLNKQIELKKYEKRLIRSDFLPQIGLIGSYNYIHGPKLNGDPLFNNGSFSAMISLKIPLFNWGEGIKKVKAKERERVMAQLQRDDLGQKMELEIQQAVNSYNEGLLEVRLTQQALRQSEENLKMSRDNYDVGIETISDYLEAQTIWQNAQSEYVVSRTKLEICKTKYLKAIGKI